MNILWKSNMANRFDSPEVAIRKVLFLMAFSGACISAEESDSIAVWPSIGAAINYPKIFDLDLGIKAITKGNTFEYGEKIISFGADFTSLSLNLGYGSFRSEVLPVGVVYSLSYARFYKDFFSKSGSNLVGAKMRVKFGLDFTASASYDLNRRDALWSVGIGYWNWRR